MSSSLPDFTAPDATAPDSTAPQPAPGQPAPQRRPPLPPDPGPEHFPASALDDGRLAWALGLLALVALPLASAALPGIAMLITGLVLSRRNRVAKSVGLRAAAFGAVGIALPALFILTLFVLTSTEPVSFDEEPVQSAILTVGAIVTAVLYPLTAIVLAIVALARPVSPAKAARILYRR